MMMMMMMMMRMMMRQERLLLLKIVEALLANLAFGSIDEHTLGVLGVPRRAMATNVIAGAMQHVNHAAECPPRRRASSSTRAAVATKERAGARRGAATASGAHGVLALRLTNSTLAREVDRDDAEELRSQVIDRAGSAAIDTVDPLTRVAGDEPGTRLAAELLSRVDDSVLAAANKAGAVLGKGLPSLQGAATKAQSMDLSVLSNKYPDILSSGVSSMFNVLSHDQISQILVSGVDAPLRFAEVLAPLITGGGWEYLAGSAR